MLDKIKKIEELVSEIMKHLKTLNLEVMPKEWCDDRPNEYYEAPRGFKVDKHGYYDEFVIQRLEDGQVIGYGCTEGNDNELVIIDFEDLSTDALIHLADYIEV